MEVGFSLHVKFDDELVSPRFDQNRHVWDFASVLVPPGHSWELVVDVEGATGRGRMSEDSVEMLLAMLTRNRLNKSMEMINADFPSSILGCSMFPERRADIPDDGKRPIHEVVRNILVQRRRLEEEYISEKSCIP
ncbi:hypothetical protein IAR50_005797 [Cryptococcus sp. DSM 104548]